MCLISAGRLMMALSPRVPRPPAEPVGLFSLPGRTCGRRQLQSGRWNSHWSISRCSPRPSSGGPRSGSWEGSPRSGQGSSATPRRQSSPRWSTGPCPRPDSALPPSLWQREGGTDWLSARDVNKSLHHRRLRTTTDDHGRGSSPSSCRLSL